MTKWITFTTFKAPTRRVIIKSNLINCVREEHKDGKEYAIVEFGEQCQVLAVTEDITSILSKLEKISDTGNF